MAQITKSKVEAFVRNAIIYRFGISHAIITNNGRQFDNQNFSDFCIQFNILHKLTSVGHPQANGEAEVINRTILHRLKTRLNEVKGSWANELNSIIWAYRTTPRSTTGESPFNLAYESEAMLSIEIVLRTKRTDYLEESSNADQRTLDLDLLQNSSLQAHLRMVAYRQRMARYYISRVKARTFRSRDLVLHRTTVSRPTDQEKLVPNWEGPYHVTEVVQPRTYRLESLDGYPMARQWNVKNLRKYH